MRRLLLPLVALGLLAAGCGGSGGSRGSSGGSVPAGASIAPSSSEVFVSVNTDFSSGQWQQTVALFDKFPGGKQLLAQAEKQLKGISLADVSQALGPETDLVLLDFQHGGGDVVVMTQPKDEAKLQALLAQGSQKPATTTVEGWTVIAQTKLQLAAYTAARKVGVLSDSDTFKKAMDGLPDAAAAKVYVAGDSVQKALARSLAKQSGASTITGSFGSLDSIAAAVVAEQGGVSLAGGVAASPKDQPETYKPDLPSKLPSGALLYVSFGHLDKVVNRVLDQVGKTQSNFKQQLGLLEGLTGLSLQGDVLPILSGEGAVAVYPAQAGEKLPGIALVLTPPDEGKAQALLDRIASAARLSGGTAVTDTTVGGATVKQFAVRGVTVFAGVVDGLLVVTNSKSVIERIQASGNKLADDPVYSQAAKGANLPDKVLGLVYANLHDSLPAVSALAKRFGTTIQTRQSDYENIKPLQSFLAYATSDGGNFPFGGFLAVK